MLVLLAVLVVLAAFQAVARRSPAPGRPLAGVVAVAALVLLGRAAGLPVAALGIRIDPAGAGWAAAGAGLVAAGFAVAVAVPALRRRAFAGTPHRLSARAAAYQALIALPLATVLVEEVAFRGVLWALLARECGTPVALLGAALLFGLWHVRPRRDPPLVVLGTVGFTTVAGLFLGGLRLASGTLLAPIAVHWAANGLGIVLAAAVWRRRA